MFALTVGVCVLMVVLAVVANQLFNIVGGFALSTNNPNAPKLFDKNIVWDLIVKITKPLSLRKVGGKWCVMYFCGDLGSNTGDSKYDTDFMSSSHVAELCGFSTKQEAKDSVHYEKTWGGVAIAWCYLVAATFSIEMAIWWFKAHAFSMLVTCAIAAVLIFLRIVSNLVRDNIGKN